MSEIVEQHVACPCGKSSDAYCVYDDGHGHCFSCGETHQDGKAGDPPWDNQGVVKEDGMIKPKRELMKGGDVVTLIKRKISAETCRKFGYTVNHDSKGKPVQVAPYHNANGQLVAQKVRWANKDFTVLGDLKQAGLFGQHLWRDGGKRLVVTEGEIDALSIAEIQKCKWPVVSVPNGASGAAKAFRNSIEWLEKFDTVVICFDQDEEGKKASVKCAEVLSPGKAAIATLPRKDPNEMLQHGEVAALQNALWDAREHRPDGIVNLADVWNLVNKPIEMGTPFPYEGLNKKLFGLRPREIVTICAGSGIGKSALCSEVAYDLAMRSKQKVGYVALEEGIDRTALRFMGLHLNRPIHLPDLEGTEGVTAEDRRRAFDETLGTGRFLSYDHWGSTDSNNLMAKLRYLVVGMQCQWLFLDHLSIVVSDSDEDEDERKLIDRTMTRLRTFTEETNVGLILVSHLKRPQGKGHEEGAMTSLSELRGSHSIAQFSDAVIGAERNQQDKDEERQNVMTLRILKNRYAGLTGEACELLYDHATGRLTDQVLEGMGLGDDVGF